MVPLNKQWSNDEGTKEGVGERQEALGGVRVEADPGSLEYLLLLKRKGLNYFFPPMDLLVINYGRGELVAWCKREWFVTNETK